MKPLSATDAAFLWMETHSQPMHVAGLNLYTPPPDAGADFVTKLVVQWREHARALGIFNRRPVLRFGVWHWDSDGDFDVDYHLRHLALPQPGRIRELLSMTSRLHGNLLDRNRPLWEAYVIEGLADGRFATYIKMHHALIDGVSGARLSAQSMSANATGNKPPLWAQEFAPKAQHARPTPGNAPRGLLAQISALADAGREVLPGVGESLADMARALAGHQTPYPVLQAPPTVLNVEISGSRRFAAQSYALSRLKRIGKAADATVNDVTLAICAGALRSYLLQHASLPDKPLIAMVPVSLHGETDEEGNQVTLLLAELGTHLDDPLDRLESIRASTTRAKEKLRGMTRLQKMAYGATSVFTQGPSMLAPWLMEKISSRHPPFNVVISNVPGPRDALYMNGALLDEIYPVSIPAHFLALNITISGYRDHLGFGFTACRRAVPSLQRMLDYTDASIRELEAALGLEAMVAEKPAVAPAHKRATTRPRSTKRAA